MPARGDLGRRHGGLAGPAGLLTGAPRIWTAGSKAGGAAQGGYQLPVGVLPAFQQLGGGQGGAAAAAVHNLQR